MLSKRDRAIWAAILVPAIICGGLVATVAIGTLKTPAAAIYILGACVASGVTTALMNRRWAADASAMLRNPELRSAPTHQTGVYSALVQESLALLERLEEESEAALERKTALEARIHVRDVEVRRLAATLDVVRHPVFIADSRGSVQYVNPAARQLLASPHSAELTLETIEPLRKLVEATRSRAAAHDTRTVEFEWPENGQGQVWRAAAKAVTDGDKLLCVCVLGESVQEENREKTRHAEFVGAVCNELKTPMAGIKAYTEMLLDGEVDDEEERQELYSFIDLQVDRLTRLVDNMLNLARIQSGVIEIDRTDCELNAVLHKALNVIRPTAEEKSIQVVEELSDLYLPVHLDQDLFGQAVINLLSNAVKYTPSGGEVRLRSRMNEDRGVIEVRDTGMGIPADSLPLIFERFYRVPENNSAAAGTGLGLSLVHYIVTELFGGTIDVASEVGEGTSFTITVPLGHRDRSRRSHQRISSATSG